jgi:hypothetical protein
MGALPLELRGYIFNAMLESKLFVPKDGVWHPPDAISVVTLLSRMIQSFPEIDADVVERFSSILGLLEMIESSLLRTILYIEMRLSLIYVGVVPNEAEFGAFLQEIGDANALITNYHRYLFVSVLRRIRDRFEGLSEIMATAEAMAMEGWIANDEAIAVFRSIESVELFDQYSSPVREIEIEGFMTRDLELLKAK